MLEEVGYAVLLVTFVSRPGLDPYAERDSFDGRNGFARNRQAVRKTANFDTH
jgi:hypothetical protein